jgi:hydroxyacylglutathione hydrolase
MVLAAACAQIATGSLNVRWDEGAKDCKMSRQPPIQVHAYNPQTFILRENLCATFEAPFMYLLMGSARALLIDDGDVADPRQMPLARTVMDLLRADGSPQLPLLVVHTHRHLDHREGDGQFARLPGVQVVGFDLESVKRFYGFGDWPNGAAQVDLGGRTVDVLPTPGHNETHLAFYDRNTALLFSGDFLMPGRLLIDDTDAERASAARMAAFAQEHPIAYVLGGHIEMDTSGQAFQWESQYHPHEHVLQMTKADLLALPAAVAAFNGFYTERGTFIMENSIRVLIAMAVAIVLVLASLVRMVLVYRRRRRIARQYRMTESRR